MSMDIDTPPDASLVAREPEPGDPVVDSPDTLTDPEAAVAAFNAALEPDRPLVVIPETEGVVNLLHGVVRQGERHLIARIRELRGTDEEVLSRLDYNRPDFGIVLVDAILRRSVEAIGTIEVSKEPTVLYDLLLGDRDVLLFHVIMATYGKEREFPDVPCPNCKHNNDLSVDLPGVAEYINADGEFREEIEFETKSGKVFLVHFPTGRVQQRVINSKQGATVGERNTMMLEECIERIDGKVPANPQQIALDMNLGDRTKLIEKLDAEQPGMRFKEVMVPCSHCDEEFPVRITWADLLPGV